MQILILSCLAYEQGNQDLQNLCLAFRARGVKCEIIAWQKLEVCELLPDTLVLPLAAWDYSQSVREFLRLLDELDAHGIKIVNDSQILRWNLSKKYLLELSNLGLPVIESVLIKGNENLSNLRQIYADGVIKPLIGQSGNGVKKLAEISTLADYKNGALLQPFIKEIVQNGEICMVFFDGVFSHAIRRQPAAGEYRANSNFGVSIVPTLADEQLQNVANLVIEKLPFSPTYVRIDLIKTRKQILINEVELIEPSLYFSHFEGSVEKFVEVILGKI